MPERIPSWPHRVRSWSVLFSLALALMACQSTTRVGDHYYSSGRYPEAAAAYQVYLDAGPADKEQTTQTLFRLGVIYATPGSAAYDPQRSVEILETLIRVYPGSSYTAEAVLLRNLQLAIGDLETEVTEDRVRLTELQVDLAERETELEGLEAQLAQRDEQVAALQETIPPLRFEIRELIRELAAKQQELEQLERLKAIDLEQPPP